MTSINATKHEPRSQASWMGHLAMMTTFVFLVPLAGCTSTSFRNVESRTLSPSQALDELVAGIRAENSLPGISVAVITCDGDIIRSVSGFADTELKQELQVTDKFLAASIGKTIVAATTLSLILSNELEIDAPVKQYFKDYDWWAKIPNSEHLTPRHLLRHQSGVPPYPGEEAFLNQYLRDALNEPDRHWEPFDSLALILGKHANFEQGGQYEYSETNYILLGLLIEEVTGKTFYDVAQERVLSRIDSNGIVPSDRRDIENLVAGYLAQDNEFNWPTKVSEGGRLIFNPALEWTGGGYASDPLSLAKWIRAYVKGAVLQSEYRQLLLDAVPTVIGDHRNRYGLGVSLVQTYYGDFIGHTGRIMGYSSIAGHLDEANMTIAIMVNKLDPAYDKMKWVEGIIQTIQDYDGCKQ